MAKKDKHEKQARRAEKARRRAEVEDPAAEIIRPLVLAPHESDAAEGAHEAPPAGTASAPALRTPDGAEVVLPGPPGRRTGARRCYADAVQVGGRTLIPVADVRPLRGARPVGYIEIDELGSRYVALQAARPGRSVLTGLLAGLAAGALAVMAGRRLR